MSVRICFDVGFSSTKIASISNEDNIPTYSKELNVVSDLGSENFDAYKGNEKDIVAFNGKHYIVGKAALQTKDQRIMKTTDFDSMKEVTPIVATKFLKNYKPDDVEYICFTLSSAYLGNSKEFHNYLTEMLPDYNGKIKLIPQGASIKRALDNIGLDVSNPSYKNSYQNYIIVDMGFNTIDVATVINGALIPEDIQGYTHTGAVLIAEEVQKQIKNTFDITLDMNRTKAVLEDKSFKQKGEVYNCKDIVNKAVNLYLEVLRDFLEKNYGDEMKAISNVLLAGGGAEIIRDNMDQWNEYYKEGFMIIPVTIGSATYLNALGGLYIK